MTDFYQLTMCYAYWKCGKSEQEAVFDLYFRTPPFDGEYTIFCGLEEALKYINAFKFSAADIEFLKTRMKDCEPEFFDYLGKLDCSKVKAYAIREGSVVFPSVPLIRIEGPLAVSQLLETTLLTLVNFSSLVATNAARYRVAADSSSKKGIVLLEFGVRRAQGPDGGMSASRYAYIGGFNGTSNVAAAQSFNISVKGTHAHSFVTSFTGLQELKNFSTILRNKNTGKDEDLARIAMGFREKVNFDEFGKADASNNGEFVSFVAYAVSFPNNFLALVDTYNTMKSGLLNFVVVALALHEFGYKAIGVRLDSGDLAYLSKKSRELFRLAGERFKVDYFEKLKICGSSDLDEEVLYSLNTQGHEIDIFGIGTNLVTCKGTPALGCVYKLVSIGGKPRIKLSNNLKKVTLPGRKEAYRLVGKDGPILDLLIEVGAEPPQVGQLVECRHPFDGTKRCKVKPSAIIPLHQLVWDGKFVGKKYSLNEIREFCLSEMNSLRSDHKYHTKPTPYKVSLSVGLSGIFQNLWLQESPVEEIN
uniref:Nicotinate phosphoribosyltransferase n=1 Tax=Arcella intermedia TaxID=1963864 RepID=A0A6B2L189_9EUKA